MATAGGGARRLTRRRALGATAGGGAALLLGGDGPVAAADGLLQARGNALTWNGAPVRLRGVGVGNPARGREDRPDSDYQVLAEVWRCNVVRISTHPWTWRHRRAEALRLLERDVAAALRQRMWVIIDWHAIGWPGGYYQKARPGWDAPEDLYDSDLALARSFWEAVAERYRGDGRVAFELWNEPVSSPAPWRSSAPGATWPELKGHFEPLLGVVRGRGAPNLVLLGGDRWAYDLRGVRASPVADANVAYTWHVYPNRDDHGPEQWAERLDDVERSFPVVVTEWGFCHDCAGEHFRGDPESFGNEFRQGFLAGRGLSHTAWCWHPVWRPSMLRDDWREPNDFGEFVMDELATGVTPRP